MHIHNLNKVVNIATKELRSLYTNEGIVAGQHHFTDYWARDGFFAALGALKIGDTDIVEKSVKLFFSYQRIDGLIPYRIMRGPVSIGKYFGKPTFYKNPIPTYKLRGIGNEVLDGTTLTVLFSAILGLNKVRWISNYEPNIKKGLSYLKSRERNGLLWDGVMAEWNDSVLKRGNLLYSNILYWYMFDRLSVWTKNVDSGWSKELSVKRDAVATSLRKNLWNGKYFADWNDYKKQNYFYPFGNCLAISWGLATKDETESILEMCKDAIANFTLETNIPKYPIWRIDPFQRIVGMGDYQNQSLLWWQPGLAYLAALNKVKKIRDYNKFLMKIIEKVNKDRTIMECYERSGEKVKRFFYTSESPFAWTSGMLLWAIK